MLGPVKGNNGCAEGHGTERPTGSRVPIPIKSGNRMQTIVHVLPYMAHGGTEKHVLTLLRRLRKDYDLILMAPRGEILDEFLRLDITYVEFKTPGLGRAGARFGKRLKEIHEDRGVDAVHVHAAHEYVSFSKRALPHVPVLFHLSAHQGSVVSRFLNYRLSASIARRKAAGLIAVSEEEARIIVSHGYPEDKVSVIYNGYEADEGTDDAAVDKLKKEYGLEGCVVVGNLGRLNKTKRLDLLIEAFAAIKGEAPLPLKLLIAGEGPEKENLRLLAQKRGIGKDAAFPGFIRRGDRILGLFDVFVLPTTHEGCSNVLVEAMAKGLPILTTNIPSVSWMFEDEKSGLLFNKNDLAGLKEKLVLLVEDPSRRAELGRGASARFAEAFTAEKMARSVDSLYRSILKRGSPPGSGKPDRTQ